MIVNLKEQQPIGMMPSGVTLRIHWGDIIARLYDVGMLRQGELVTHVSSDLYGLTFRVEYTPQIDR